MARQISKATALFLLATSGANAFVPTSGSSPAVGAFANAPAASTSAGRRTTSLASTEVSVDPKEAVKLFGRLAEKYIMLDDSGGMCCYSACSEIGRAHV